MYNFVFITFPYFLLCITTFWSDSFRLKVQCLKIGWILRRGICVIPLDSKNFQVAKAKTKALFSFQFQISRSGKIHNRHALLFNDITILQANPSYGICILKLSKMINYCYYWDEQIFIVGNSIAFRLSKRSSHRMLN